jgi:RNase P/RNase MRP subunit p29
MRFPFPGRAILCLAMCGACLLICVAVASAANPASDTIQGKLVIGPQGALHVTTASGDVVVTSSDASILHTLQDPRMNGRQVRLEGRLGNSPGASGLLDVAHVFTVHDGKVFRLRFYCHVCNIPATEPGPCVCCQRWTDLEEIPVDQVTDDMVLVP